MGCRGMSRELTKEEVNAIRALERLAKKWPQTLQLFSWSGSLVVMDAGMVPGEAAVFTTIIGIPNDGGDPDGN
jgi:hypothetical protein